MCPGPPFTSYRFEERIPFYNKVTYFDSRQFWQCAFFISIGLTIFLIKTLQFGHLFIQTYGITSQFRFVHVRVISLSRAAVNPGGRGDKKDGDSCRAFKGSKKKFG